MRHFMVHMSLRPGLHCAEEADFLQLSAAMEAEGFSYLITGSSGASFQLPPGEYFIAGAYTRAEVLAKARRAAATLHRSCSILITQGEAFLWWGLKKARAIAIPEALPA
jgi:hypothetical protein